MDVCLLGVRGEFTNATGHGVNRYMHYLYENLDSMKPKNVKIIKREVGTIPYLHSMFTIAARSMMHDFSMYDIVHLLDIRLISYARYGQAISITTVHDFRPLTTKELDADMYRSVHGLADLHLVRTPAIKAALNSDYLIANSTQTKEEAVSLGFERRKVFVTNLGVDQRFFKKKVGRRTKSKLFKVGYVGGVQKAKNPIFAVKAFRSIKGYDMSMELWGLGSGPAREALTRAIGPDRRIKFLGLVPEDRKVEIYDTFDVFVFPSLYEGFGIPIIEAQARGVPVIIYKNGMIPKEVAKYCMKADDEDHMAQLITNIKENGYNDRDRRRAVQYARGFTWERMAKQTVDVYRLAYKEQGRR